LLARVSEVLEERVVQVPDHRVPLEQNQVRNVVDHNFFFWGDLLIILQIGGLPEVRKLAALIASNWEVCLVELVLIHRFDLL